MPLINDLYHKFRQFFSGHWPRLYCFCEARKSVIKFIVAGCFAGGSDLVFLFFFYGLLHWNIVISTSLAFILSFVVSFTMQKFWTFRNYNKQMAGQLFLYLLNAFLGLNMNGWLMHLLVNRFHIWYLLAQIAVNITLAFYNFLVYKFIIFREEKDEVKRQQKAAGGSADDLA